MNESTSQIRPLEKGQIRVIKASALITDRQVDLVTEAVLSAVNGALAISEGLDEDKNYAQGLVVNARQAIAMTERAFTEFEKSIDSYKPPPLLLGGATYSTMLATMNCSLTIGLGMFATLSFDLLSRARMILRQQANVERLIKMHFSLQGIAGGMEAMPQICDGQEFIDVPVSLPSKTTDCRVRSITSLMNIENNVGPLAQAYEATDALDA